MTNTFTNPNFADDKSIDIDIDVSETSSSKETSINMEVSEDNNIIERRKGRILSIVKDVIIFMLIITSFIFAIKWWTTTSDANSIVSENLVARHYATKSAFLGYEFTPELLDAIKSREIDLYGINVVTPSGSDSDRYFIETSKAVPGTASKLKIIKAEYVYYTQEYIDEYFAPGYTPSLDGYWLVTIDLA